MSGIDFLIGIKTDNFVMVAADQTVFLHGAITVKTDEDKSFQLTDKLVMYAFGEGGDPVQFSEYLSKNIQLYKMRNGYELGAKAACHYARRLIAQNLRTRDAYSVLTVLGGYDDQCEEPYLASIDYLGTKFEGSYLTQGFGGKFAYSILDNIHRADWTEAQAIEAMKLCMVEVKKRFLANLPNFQVHVIDKDGIRRLDDIKV